MNEQTPHLGLPLPHPANDLGSDVLRLRAALQTLDGHVGALQTALQSDDVALDQLQELVDAIKANRGDIAALLSLKASAEALEAEVQARQQGDEALAQQLVEKTKSLDDLQWQPISTNIAAKAGQRYLLLESVTVTLPETTHVTAGSVIEFAKLSSACPVIQPSDDARVFVGGNSGDSVLFNIDARILFVFNGDSWEV